MGSEKTLSLPERLEPAHEFFAFAGRPVRSLHAVVETFVGPVIRIRREIADRFDMAAQLVCDDDARGAETGHKALHETPCRLGVAPRLDEYLQNISSRVNRPPEPVFHAADRHSTSRAALRVRPPETEHQ